MSSSDNIKRVKISSSELWGYTSVEVWERIFGQLGIIDGLPFEKLTYRDGSMVIVQCQDPEIIRELVQYGVLDPKHLPKKSPAEHWTELKEYMNLKEKGPFHFEIEDPEAVLTPKKKKKR